MQVTKLNEIILGEYDILLGLYTGKIESLENINITDDEIIEKFNYGISKNADQIPKLKKFVEQDISIEIFDKTNQLNWFMPKDYYPNLVEYLYGLCNTKEQIDRVTEELELFIQFNMLDVLFYLKYLVDTLRSNNIVWGVGRGSSVASYCLYLLGVHKVDSLRYDLDIHEFLK